MLALVVCSLVVALAYPLRQYIAQRAEIAELERDKRDAQQRVEELRDEKARWEDPEYVRRQAREHLHYVLPGETGYLMRDGSGSARSGAAGEAADRPWYENLWDGLDAADGRR
ncbi:hypothetical protein GCM10009802_38220 [Streptomyces synnematoformans]|uniref:Septum formation initiator family protein n=1 Tax=Streptomyces synnematoformans TaxID=415721 RepID=A0ABP5KBZ2_9ACTN